MDYSTKKISLALTILYFVSAFMNVFSEFFSLPIALVLSKTMVSITLISLYYFSSKKKQLLFFIALLFSLFSKLFFISNDENFIFYGALLSFLNRILLIILIFKLLKVKDYIPFVLITIPLGFIFEYLFTSSNIPEKAYYFFVFQNIIAAILGGIAISSYIMKDTKQHSLLLISVMLFLGMELVFFIEKFDTVYASSSILRIMIILLNVFGFYTFYRFLIESEKLNTD